MMSTLRSYEVRIPINGWVEFIFEATSAEEAKRLAIEAYEKHEEPSDGLLRRTEGLVPMVTEIGDGGEE